MVVVSDASDRKRSWWEQAGLSDMIHDFTPVYAHTTLRVEICSGEDTFYSIAST